MKVFFLLCLTLTSYITKADSFVAYQGLTTSKAMVTSVARIADCVLKSEKFLNEVATHSYTFTSATSGEQVADSIRKAHITLTVSTYKSKLPWSKTVAYRNAGETTAYLNLRKNPAGKDIAEVVNTLVHEWLHVLGYGHGTNSAKGKENSVPYGVGSIAGKYVGGCK